jgi:hypothetical protein
LSKVKDHHLLVTRNNLLSEIDGLTQEEMNFHSEENRWSIAQVCHHLALTEETFAKAIAYGLKTSTIYSEPKKIDFMLDRSIKLEAPEIVQPLMESFTSRQLVDQLSNSRKILMSILNTVDDTAILSEKSVKHPFLGDLPLFQWIELIYLHEQRHIQQIQENKTQYRNMR